MCICPLHVQRLKPMHLFTTLQLQQVHAVVSAELGYN
jgi:hypothetical protein